MIRSCPVTEIAPEDGSNMVKHGQTISSRPRLWLWSLGKQTIGDTSLFSTHPQEGSTKVNKSMNCGTQYLREQRGDFLSCEKLFGNSVVLTISSFSPSSLTSPNSLEAVLSMLPSQSVLFDSCFWMFLGFLGGFYGSRLKLSDSHSDLCWALTRLCGAWLGLQKLNTRMRFLDVGPSGFDVAPALQHLQTLFARHLGTLPVVAHVLRNFCEMLCFQTWNLKLEECRIKVFIAIYCILLLVFDSKSKSRTGVGSWSFGIRGRSLTWSNRMCFQCGNRSVAASALSEAPELGTWPWGTIWDQPSGANITT